MASETIMELTEKFGDSSLFKAEQSKLIKEIFELQEQRVHIWNEFDLKFKEYTLDAPNFRLKRLQLICKEISDQLNSISTQMIAIREKFSKEVFNVHRLHELVERLQEHEQIKFQLTLELYVCEQDRLEKLAVTDEHEFTYQGKITEIKRKLTETKLNVNDCLEELRYEMHDE